MMNYKTVEGHEREKAVQLSTRIFKENMANQFLLLFGEDNKDHIFICKDEEEVVSMVTYYPSIIQLGNAHVKAGSIGSVCTDPEYRHKGIAYDLLLLAEKKMLEEKRSIAIISGEGGLYERFHSSIVGNVYGYMFKRNQIELNPSIRIEKYNEYDLEKIFKLYQNENLKFERTFEEFRLLFDGQTYPDTFQDYPVFLIYKKEEPVSYIIVNRPVGKRSLLVKEYAGDREAVFASIPYLLKELKKFNLTITCDPTDSFVGVANCPHQETHLHASLKVVDVRTLLEDLKPYIKEQLKQESKFSATVTEDKTILLWDSQALLELTQEEVNHLVFSPSYDIIKRIPNEELKALMKKCFPIPFVWVHNLNYQ